MTFQCPGCGGDMFESEIQVSANKITESILCTCKDKCGILEVKIIRGKTR